MPARKSLVLLMFAAAALSAADLHLSYRSPIDNTDQPYRLYIPANPNGALVIAMHGTGGNENTLFDDDAYKQGDIRAAAEKTGAMVASPLGRGITEYRGIGENDVLTVLEEVRKTYSVDADRIYLTGHSMGGTGAAYLALRHPDLFAAAAPLAAAYSFPWLARNAAKIPFLWIGGAIDEDFYHRGVAVGVEQMRKFGAPVILEMLPGEGHGGPVKDFTRVFEWLLKHKRDPHPDSYFFGTDSPMHGRAWWTTIERIALPGQIASVEAKGLNNVVQFQLTNVAEIAFRPDPAIFDLAQPIAVRIGGAAPLTTRLASTQEALIERAGAAWRVSVRGEKPYSVTDYRVNPVARAAEKLDMTGTEKRLGNWMADSIRHATGADIALVNGVYYRGLGIPRGTVDIVDLIQCSRPFDQSLVTLRLTGAEIAAILDDNIPHPKKDRPSRIDSPGASRLLQVSGMTYAFDSARPDGRKILRHSLDPAKTYMVAMEGQAMERETVWLAGRSKKLLYQTTGIPLTLALYGYAAGDGVIAAKIEGRVKEEKYVAPPPNPVLAPITDTAGLPRVLVIGDSISMGYTLPVRRALNGQANVHRIGENGGPTIRALTNIETWLVDGRWDVIHFNFGLHDLRYMDTGKQQVSPADYERNLKTIVSRLKQTGAKLIWATTTPVPEGELNPPRKFYDTPKYNAIAARVMAEAGIQINDLYSLVLPQAAAIQRPHDVHFTDEGYEVLARQVTDVIRRSLPRQARR